MAKYNMTFEEAQEYISKRGFDIAWSDCDVFIDVRHITQAIGNILKWADEHPKEEPVSEDLDEAAKADAMIERPDDTGVGYDLNRYGGFISGAQWREDQMMKGAFEFTKKHNDACVLASECLRDHGWFSIEHDFNDLFLYLSCVDELFAGKFSGKTKVIVIKEDLV